MAEQTNGFGQGLNLDFGFRFIHGTGAPGSYGGEPDLAPQGSLYTDDVDGLLYRKHVAGTGTAVWSLVASEKLPTEVLGITVGLALIDEVPTQKTKSMVWSIDLEDAVDNTKRTFIEVHAVHNGSSTQDATFAEFNVANVVRTGGGVVSFTVDVRLAGSGANQTMQLYVSE